MIKPIVVLFLMYLFVISIHVVFVGISAYAIWGKYFTNWKKWQIWLVLLVPIVFFEFYWIPVMNYLDISIFVGNQSILDFFNLSENTDIVKSYHVAWFQPILFFLAVIVSQRIGQYYYLKNK